MADTDRAPGWGVLLSAEYRRFTVTLVFSIALHAGNFFIFATLAPSVVADVGGLHLLNWATTLFVVATIVSAATVGVLKARFGARRTIIIAATLFAIGSLLTAIAPTIEMVLFGRTVQGLGAGLLTACSHGMIRDLFPSSAWARLFAVISGSWGVAAISGPLIGGLFAEYGTWRWGFITMVILAGLFVPLALKSLPEGDQEEEAGSAGQFIRLAGLGIAALTLGGIGKFEPAWADPLLGVACLACIILTIRLENRSRDPLFPRGVFRPTTTMGGGALFVFGITFATVATSIYGPLLFRVIHDIPVLTTGYIVTAQSIAWTAAAILFAGLHIKGGRIACIAGPMITASGIALTGIFLPSGPVSAAIAGIVVIGFGIGLAWGHVGRFMFEAAATDDRHRVGSVMPTMQSIGIAFGSSVAGVIANAAGFDMDIESGAAVRVAGWLYFGLIPACLLAVLGGLRVAATTAPFRTVG